jgi:hypothetical protein
MMVFPYDFEPEGMAGFSGVAAVWYVHLVSIGAASFLLSSYNDET